ncbi:hypothetical protein PInf_022138 [Phytophthora infestans]|nr:hypothetical protein PInf_022138 [Phytophthora infestans]
MNLVAEGTVKEVTVYNKGVSPKICFKQHRAVLVPQNEDLTLVFCDHDLPNSELSTTPGLSSVGNQILAPAVSATTYKMKYGNREGVHVALVNPYIATVQTSKLPFYKVYFVPVRAKAVLEIIDKEKADEILVQDREKLAAKLAEIGETIAPSQSKGCRSASVLRVLATRRCTARRRRPDQTDSGRSESAQVEYEVVRDTKDNCITENSNYFKLRSTAQKFVRHFGIMGEFNIPERNCIIEPPRSRWVLAQEQRDQDDTAYFGAKSEQLCGQAASLGPEDLRGVHLEDSAMLNPNLAGLDGCAAGAPPMDERLFNVISALDAGYTINRVHELTKIDNWFLARSQPDIWGRKSPEGVIVSVGGQIPNNLVMPLSQAGVKSSEHVAGERRPVRGPQ